jgi:hypothetical protein
MESSNYINFIKKTGEELFAKSYNIFKSKGAKYLKNA